MRCTCGHVAERACTLSGNPSILTSLTAFATTGPGAYTQTTGSSINAYWPALPANQPEPRLTPEREA